MGRRFVSIWFRYLKTDCFTLRVPALQGKPFVLASPDHGRMVITASNPAAEAQGVYSGMVVADARAAITSLQVFDDEPGFAEKLLRKIAEWAIRYTPLAAIDLPDGLLLDVTGCTHLWGDEKNYLDSITTRLEEKGYRVRAAMADTIGTAWAIARFEKRKMIVTPGEQANALFTLPSAALRLETTTNDHLQKLGLRHIKDFISMPANALRRRFGVSFVERIAQALGHAPEHFEPVFPPLPFQEHLPCLEPIATRTGIDIALQQLLQTICMRLEKEGKGLRTAHFECFRLDGKKETICIGTTRASHNPIHLFKLFENKIDTIEPALGIELFLLSAPKVEDLDPIQDSLWSTSAGLTDLHLAELLDRFAGKFGTEHIHRYLPAEHYWPERAVKLAVTLDEISTTSWKTDRPRPIHLLHKPEKIEVTAPIPDYPPMLFRYRNQVHKIKKADGPERIEQEWWLQQGEHRDYYYLEDEDGKRYWVFRLGHYTADRSHQWFLHGFFT